MRTVFLAVGMVLLAHVALADTAQKIGYVDLQRALLEVDNGKKAQEELKSQVTKTEGKLKKQKDEIDGLRSRLEKNGATMKEEERASLEDDYRRKARAFETDVSDSQAELQKKEKELTGAILKDLQTIILQYGQEHEYAVILGTNSGAVVYGSKGADVTDAIIQRYNSGPGAKKKEK